MSTKVSEEEFVDLEARARARKLTLSEWVRAELLEPRDDGGTAADEVLLGEVLALRTILMNLLFSIWNGKAVTPEAMRELIEKADGDKARRAETYDNKGNTLSTGGKVFTYDSENRLKTMNGSAVSIVYDGDGNRVAKTSGGLTTRYLVDDLNPTGYAQVVEELVGAAVQREYSYGLQRIDENQLISNTWTPSFYGYDGGGTVRQLTNSSGAVTDKYDYDAFGNLINTTGTTPNNYLYRGEQYDQDLGLYYLRARYYNPLTGRFMSRDPEEGKIRVPATLHKYLYASVDPVNRFDPTGRADLIEVDLENAEVTFSKHGAIHLLKEGYDLVQTQAQVEAYVEALVREFLAEWQASGGTIDVMFNSPLLQNIPWAVRVFIVSAADIRIGTYFPQNRP